MSFNENLVRLYEKVDVFGIVDEYTNNLADETDNAVYPLFLKSSEEYETADVKIMIFGKETDGWGGTYGTGVSVNEIMNVYNEFFLSEYCYSYGGQFWNGVKYFINTLKEKNQGKKISYLWNNIVKIGYDKMGFPYNFYDTIVKPHFNEIIVKEIEILMPDYIVFFTGPDSQNGPYDSVLNNIFSTPVRKVIEGFTERQLCEIIIPNVKKSFRTYHPKFLFMNNIDKYCSKIIEEITKDIK
jgi:hypothetical protein